MSERDVVFTVLSGSVLTFATVYVLSPFDSFTITKRSLALSLAGFAGISILGYCFIDDVFHRLLNDITVVVEDNNVIFRTPQGDVLSAPLAIKNN
jgi:hypothetical protein